MTEPEQPVVAVPLRARSAEFWERLRAMLQKYPPLPPFPTERIADDNGDELEHGQPDFPGQFPEEKYGPKVRWLRQGARMSGRELCRVVTVTPSYLSDIETGRRLPAPAVSDRIADALGVDRDALWRLALLERLSERDLRVLYRDAKP